MKRKVGIAFETIRNGIVEVTAPKSAARRDYLCMLHEIEAALKSLED